jgi:hypothetical protein
MESDGSGWPARSFPVVSSAIRDLNSKDASR